MKSSGKSFQTILVAFIALALVSGIFVASNATTTAMDNVVVCVNKKTGTMRLPMKDKCKKKEQKIVLARTGPQGIQGVQGAIGPAGPAGPIGSGGNYLNSQFAVYDAQGKLVPVEILSLHGGATVQFKGFAFQLDTLHFASDYDGDWPQMIFKDKECKTPVADFQNNSWSTALFPRYKLLEGNVYFWTTKRGALSLNSWNDLSKYGKIYLKFELIDLDSSELDWYRENLFNILRKADSSLTDEEIRAIVEKVKLGSPTLHGLSKASECVELGKYLDSMQSMSKSNGVRDIVDDLIIGGRRNSWLNEAIDFSYLQEASEINNLAEIFHWSELTAYLEENRTGTYRQLLRGIRRFEKWYIFRNTFELMLWREFNFPFEFPLEIKKRK